MLIKMKYIGIGCALSSLLLFNICTPAYAYQDSSRGYKTSMVYNPEYYTDIKGSWAENSLKNAAINGILSGTSATTMSPNKELTRAQMAAMLVRIFNTSDNNDSLARYIDVDRNAWYYGELSKAVGMGIIQGYGGYIYPNSLITRQEACALLARSFSLQDRSTRIQSYYDYDEIADWAYDSVSACDAVGALRASNYNINPNQTISRAEFASMIYSIVQDFDTVQVNTIGNYNISAIVTDSSKRYDNLHLRSNLYVASDNSVNLYRSYINGKLVLKRGDVFLRDTSTVNTLIVDDCTTDLSITTDASSRISNVIIKECSSAIELEGYFGTVLVESSASVNINNSVIQKISVSPGFGANITIDNNSIIDSVPDNLGIVDSRGDAYSASKEFPITSYMSPMDSIVVSSYNPITFSESYNLDLEDLISNLEISGNFTDNIIDVGGTFYEVTIDGVKGYYLPLRFMFTGVEEDFTINIDNQTVSSTRGYAGTDIRLNFLIPISEDHEQTEITFVPVEGSRYHSVTMRIRLKDSVRFK